MKDTIELEKLTTEQKSFVIYKQHADIWKLRGFAFVMLSANILLLLLLVP